MLITKQGDNLIVKIPLHTKRFNPYDEEYHGTMNNIVGVIEEKEGWKEIGFRYSIDRSYKGKDDDIGNWCVKYHGSKEDFEKLCDEFKIPLWII